MKNNVKNLIEFIDHSPSCFHVIENARKQFMDHGFIELKEKEYSKQLFSRTVYPILADHREDNRGNSNIIRYRKEPIVYQGKNIYFTTQWFASNRNDVISWYKKHL